MREFRLELWPGYLTSIRQHEHNILMCSEITHKIMRQQTLLDILNDCYNTDSRDYKVRRYDRIYIYIYACLCNCGFNFKHRLFSFIFYFNRKHSKRKWLA